MKTVLKIIGLALVAGVIVFVVAVLWPRYMSDDGNINKSEVHVAPKIVGAKTRVLFAGTTFWGRHTNEMARASDLGVKYPFSKLSTLHREDYNAWIGGLECPTVEKEGKHNKYEEESLFQFNCDPDYLPEAAKYFDAFLLGNNHTDNQGAEGFVETKKRLAENGIQYFGSYDYTDGQNNCDVIVLPIDVTFDDNSVVEYKMPFAFCSAHGVFGIPYAPIENMKNYTDILPTVAMPHMGAEYQASHDTLRQNLYRSMIDNGVENVIGDHPHWTQDTEAYKGKLIVYSMGNFMFDQTFSKEVSRSAAIDATITFEKIDQTDFEKWNDLAEQCLSDKANCAKKIREAKLPKVSLAWSYSYHGTTSANDRITRLASDAEQTEIGQRLNWWATMNALKK